ncbi:MULTISPECIES: ABC transporter ATP-binding protein [Arthrobacter]|uniref:ATP-binding cassette domain-containing protein n=1 Tax=Arthrobacter TaxID=1663 RepID=UPI00197A725E|nr:MULTISPECIES: ABC transporter ATP-binding protein [Arthrobacter]MBT8161795.1 ABC transporter ATP-binding protein [Arthrobacter sp. GN70]
MKTMTNTPVQQAGERRPAPGTLLSVPDLTIEAGSKELSVRLVDRFSLDMAPGDRVALVGESGSGKSVTARAIMRVDPDFRLSGSIDFQGQNLLKLSEKDMVSVRGHKIGMVFLDPMGALNPLMTIGEQVMEPLRIAGVKRAEAERRAKAVLEELVVVNAAARMKAYPHEFSGGMRQRVVLAMALISNPSLIIADGPTTALDVRVQEQVPHPDGQDVKGTGSGRAPDHPRPRHSGRLAQLPHPAV